MAEAIWRELAGDSWNVASAGTKPAGYVHPLAIAALQEAGFPTDGLYSKSVDDVRHRSFDLVISVCDVAEKTCPVWTASPRRLNWPLADPAKPNRADESIVDFVMVRDALRRRIDTFLRAESGLPASLRETLTISSPEMDAAAIHTAIWLVRRALAEDLHGQTDITSAAIVPPDAQGTASFVSRSAGTLCGLGVCQLVVAELDGAATLSPLLRDGSQVEPGTVIATVRGSARAILLLERTCLNFLGKLSGISSLTARFVAEVQGTPCHILDTRKTTPGWRALEKYAVRCGGGQNHRRGLYDAVLIKDNHLALCRHLGGSQQMTIDQAIGRARRWLAEQQSETLRHTPIEIEVDSIDQLKLALPASPDIVLLDNMNVETMRQCVAMRNQIAPRVLLEASGGITLESVRSIAQTGVDRISAGALTHSATNLDIALDWL